MHEIGLTMVRVVKVLIAGNLTRLCPSSLSWSLRQCLLILFCEVCRSYLKKGLTIWLNVPLDALARRIAAVGSASRPLLHQQSGDPYAKVGSYWGSYLFLQFQCGMRTELIMCCFLMQPYAKLTSFSEQRIDSYANADARVSLESSSITPIYIILVFIPVLDATTKTYTVHRYDASSSL